MQKFRKRERMAMIIPSPSSHESCNAFSIVSFETTHELTRNKYLGDLEAPTVVREDATMSTSTGSDTMDTHDDDDEYPWEDHSDCPSLQRVSFDRLPSRMVDPLDGRAKGPPSTVECSLDNISRHSCMGAFMACPFAMAVVAVCVGLSQQVSLQSMHGGVAMGGIVAIFLGQIFLLLGLVAFGDYEIPLVGKNLQQHLIGPLGV